MKLHLTLTLALCALAGCATETASTVVVAGTQKCMPRDAPIGTHMPSRKCEPVSDEERAQAQADAQAMRDDYNRRNTVQTLKP